MKTYKIIDLFCGTGGFSHGFVDYGHKFEVVAAVDNNKDACLTAGANHKGCYVVHDDIRHVRPSTIQKHLKQAKVDVIIGGPPCQGFSSLRPFRSGKEDDPRNSLFEQFALYVNYFSPKYFVLENVVGLLTHKNGKTLYAIEECFGTMNYSTDWRVLNAANYGVPQKRERFIMIGVKGKRRVSFPKPTHSFTGRGIGYRDRNKMVMGEKGLKNAVTVMDALSDLPELSSGEQRGEYATKPQNDYQGARRRGSQRLSLHVAANHSPQLLKIMQHAGANINNVPSHLITSGFSSCYSRMEGNEPATTITVKFSSPASNKCIHPIQDRAITPREAARLQSFDDSFVFCGSKTSIITQLGNAVPPLLGRAIAGAIYGGLESAK